MTKCEASLGFNPIEDIKKKRIDQVNINNGKKELYLVLYRTSIVKVINNS